jgi:Fe-S cluster biogenesis protein NfuA/nitrite reductase/ring-hydroxylating ferredoxin subunit
VGDAVVAADDVAEVGDRIDQALQALAAVDDPLLRELAESTVRLVVELYGLGLERIVALIAERSPETLATMTEDELVASLLVVHDLHPETVTQRVQRALDDVRPYLASHGGDVELLEVTEGVVRLQLLGNCDGCPSSSATLQLAVVDAITSTAPEVEDVQVDQAPPTGPSPPLIDPGSLFERPPGFGAAAAPTPAAPRVDQLERAGGPQGRAGHLQEPAGARPGRAGGPSWEPLPRSSVPDDPGVRGAAIGDLEVIVVRTSVGVYVYRDACGGCAGPLEGATLAGVELACGKCGARFHAEEAGRALDATDGRLDPLPLLERGGRLEVAVPVGARR